MKLESGHSVEPLSEEELKKHHQDWAPHDGGLVRLNPGRWMLPSKFKLFANPIYNFKFKNSDVVIMTYPKCGTTWTQEIVWTMLHNPNLDNPEANNFILTRSPFLDMDMLLPNLKGPPPKNDPIGTAFMQNCPGKDPANGINLQLAEVLPDRRVIKTHLPYTLMPPAMLDTTKVIYVARNPKDVVVSYHHHCRINAIHDYTGSFEDFVQYFLNDDAMYGPYWLHVKEAWEKRKHPNQHIIFFEDMKANPLEELKKLNTFINAKLTEEQLEKITKFTSFPEMKARMIASGFNEDDLPLFKKDIVKKEGGFFRKGQSGDWKNKMTPELIAKVDEWINTNFTSFGIKFSYGI